MSRENAYTWDDLQADLDDEGLAFHQDERVERVREQFERVTLLNDPESDPVDAILESSGGIAELYRAGAGARKDAGQAMSRRLASEHRTDRQRRKEHAGEKYAAATRKLVENAYIPALAGEAEVAVAADEDETAPLEAAWRTADEADYEGHADYRNVIDEALGRITDDAGVSQRARVMARNLRDGLAAEYV